MVKPSYGGDGIVNLMASIRAGLGGDPGPYPALGLLPPSRVAEARTVLLMVIDGLGDHFFARHATTSATHRLGRVTSVFPTATAPAVTTFLTGVAPCQHGILGWHMWMRELGAVVAVLPFRPRLGGPGLVTAGIEAGGLIGAGPFWAHEHVESSLVSPLSIVDSAFNRALSGRARAVPYLDTPDFFRAVEREATRGDRRYIYAYWPGYDAVCHAHGTGSDFAGAHFRELEAGILQLTEALAGTDTLLLVTADHGFVDLGPGDVTRLEHHPELAECLAVPLCGEPRAAFCHLRSGSERRFERLVAERLADRFTCLPGADLIADGWFGSGRPDARLAARLGDYVLLGRGHDVIYDTLPHQKPVRHVGVHGGIAADEMYVPLLCAEC